MRLKTVVHNLSLSLLSVPFIFALFSISFIVGSSILYFNLDWSLFPENVPSSNLFDFWWLNILLPCPSFIGGFGLISLYLAPSCIGVLMGLLKDLASLDGFFQFFFQFLYSFFDIVLVLLDFVLVEKHSLVILLNYYFYIQVRRTSNKFESSPLNSRQKEKIPIKNMINITADLFCISLSLSLC